MVLGAFTSPFVTCLAVVDPTGVRGTHDNTAVGEGMLVCVFPANSVSRFYGIVAILLPLHSSLLTHHPSSCPFRALAQTARDCWTVAFGNAYTEEDRCLAAGYDNGDVKLFDLRTQTMRWETNVKNGVTGLDFDRNDIEMNKVGGTETRPNITGSKYNSSGAMLRCFKIKERTAAFRKTRLDGLRSANELPDRTWPDMT